MRPSKCSPDPHKTPSLLGLTNYTLRSHTWLPSSPKPRTSLNPQPAGSSALPCVAIMGLASRATVTPTQAKSSVQQMRAHFRANRVAFQIPRQAHPKQALLEKPPWPVGPKRRKALLLRLPPLLPHSFLNRLQRGLKLKHPNDLHRMARRPPRPRAPPPPPDPSLTINLLNLPPGISVDLLRHVVKILTIHLSERILTNAGLLPLRVRTREKEKELLATFPMLTSLAKGRRTISPAFTKAY